MKAKLTVLAVALTVIAAAAAVLAAPAGATMVTERYAVTADKPAESHPDLCGANLVWQVWAGDDWNIAYAPSPTSAATVICSDPADQILPRVSVDENGHVLVVWEDHRNGNADIYGYDVTNHQALVICDQAAQQVAPRISGDWVVWQDDRNGNWDIYGATIDTSQSTDTVSAATPICTEAHDQIEPDVSGDTVVWVDTRYGDDDIMGYNRVADQTYAICLNDAVQDQPAVSGDTVVWRDFRNEATEGTDIYGCDLVTGREFPVCTAPGDQGSPAIDQDLVVWTDGRSAASGLDVRAFDLTLQQNVTICLAAKSQYQPTVSIDPDRSADPYRVVWCDQRTGTADLWGADLTPWTLRLTIDGGKAWTRSSTASLRLFAQGKTGMITQMTLANVFEGAPAGVAAPYATVESPWYLLPKGDGHKWVSAVFTDLNGFSSPTIKREITLDTHGPQCYVPKAVTVTRGTTASIGVRVKDNLSPTVAAIVRVFNARGDVVKTMAAPELTRNALHQFTFVCNLAAGTYTVKVVATDLAGNKQTLVGSNTLTVQ
jgi:beta propeller repeat protein